MVVSIIITNFMVSKVLIDQGNSTDILYWRTFHRLEVSPDIVHPHAGPLLGFVGKIVKTRDYVDLMTTFGQRQLSRSLTIRFLLVDVAPYPPTRKSAKPHRTTIEGTQVMSMDEGSPIRALTVHQASLDDEFDIDPREDTSGRGPKSIEELVSSLTATTTTKVQGQGSTGQDDIPPDCPMPLSRKGSHHSRKPGRLPCRSP
ncbi:hypothetical protein JHK84_040346 [Glycine max]|nr:hypothetical protein JHK84_040346 [Glycine max]